jgi:hypothetical protein
MRLVLSLGFASIALASVASSACKGSSSSGPPAAVRFLPADPDTAFRIDVPRVRGWSIYKELSAVALSGVEMILKSANEKCGLDVMGTATTIIGAKKDALMAGDVTLIVAGISQNKVAECLETIATSKSMLQVTRDGELFHAKIQDKSIASGAVLPTGEIVLVARKGAGVEPAAWKTEVTQGAKSVPAWWTELQPYLGEPIAVRAGDDKRTVFATVTFTDTLAVRAKVVTKSDADAKGDSTRINAILSYLQNAKAGNGKVETQGSNVFAEITAKGPEIEALIKTGGGAVFTRNAELPTEPAVASRDYECSELSQAVGDYMNAALESAGKSPQMMDMVTKVTPPLQKAYVEACTEGAWADAAIECHVINATNLPKFEKCRIGLSEAQRGPFDTKVAAVLSQIQAPAPAAGSGSAGSGSAGSGSAAGSAAPKK